MPKGLLRVQGTLDLTQFWPSGESDADTVKVSVDTIEYSPDPTAHLPFVTVDIFQHARVKGAGGAPAPPIKKGKITVRLQGIDATELHFAAMLPKKGLKDNGTKYRQYFGETATTKLHDHLFSLHKKNLIPCEAVSFVDKPNEVFDMYGRMVGDVLVRANGKQVNINHWLVENGWALPAFYNSMLDTEIKTIASLAQAAQKGQKKGVWKHLSQDATHPNLKLRYRPHDKPHPQSDRGAAVMPKLFRRQIRYSVATCNHIFSGGMAAYLIKQKDAWVKTGEFLRHPKTKPSKGTGNLGVLLNKKGQFTVAPGEIVFFEKPSTLVDEKNRKIVSWSG